MTDIPLPIEGLVYPDADPTLTHQQRFEQFAAANEWVGAALIALFDDAKAHGIDRWGVKAAFEVLRWRYSRETTGKPWRLNNNTFSRYARWLIEERPDLAPMIRTRELRAA